VSSRSPGRLLIRLKNDVSLGGYFVCLQWTFAKEDRRGFIVHAMTQYKTGEPRWTFGEWEHRALCEVVALTMRGKYRFPITWPCACTSERSLCNCSPVERIQRLCFEQLFQDPLTHIPRHHFGCIACRRCVWRISHSASQK